MTPSNRWWVLCAAALSFVARFGSCTEHSAVQPELFIFNELCALKDDSGPCKAIKERFFFNVNAGVCQLFEYGGCAGNANNFLTMDECEETCVVSDDKNPCHLAEAPGPCRGLMKRYFFDSSSQRCVHFFYGGCFGNANNFRSMSECRARCQSPDPTKTPELHTRSARRFAAVQPTVLNGELSELEGTENNTSREPNATSPSELCFTPVNRGSCKGAEKRFAFNPKTKRCHAFLYSGCGGNANNFTGRKECIVKCIRNGKAHRKGAIRIKKKNRNIFAGRSA
ncbi:tissue factor pathway inhibitor a isoform X2 [Pseudoliparis swirei]|uniref:tissue factor pathway inhibitor a isoform X2 n=1 Tax=Pseudoliparis swirei TaxID=2059687 RepID=UPI0024BE4D3F|nr:tissue factor pathway inhibitor a isoform X2 [Pseudoliparis swirei]